MPSVAKQCEMLQNGIEKKTFSQWCNVLQKKKNGDSMICHFVIGEKHWFNSSFQINSICRDCFFLLPRFCCIKIKCARHLSLFIIFCSAWYSTILTRPAFFIVVVFNNNNNIKERERLWWALHLKIYSLLYSIFCKLNPADISAADSAKEMRKSIWIIRFWTLFSLPLSGNATHFRKFLDEIWVIKWLFHHFPSPSSIHHRLRGRKFCSQLKWYAIIQFIIADSIVCVHYKAKCIFILNLYAKFTDTHTYIYARTSIHPPKPQQRSRLTSRVGGCRCVCVCRCVGRVQHCTEQEIRTFRIKCNYVFQFDKHTFI